MSDVDKYISRKDARSPGFKSFVEEELENLKIGKEIRQLRLSSGMTQKAWKRGFSQLTSGAGPIIPAPSRRKRFG